MPIATTRRSSHQHTTGSGNQYTTLALLSHLCHLPPFPWTLDPPDARDEASYGCFHSACWCPAWRLKRRWPAQSNRHSLISMSSIETYKTDHTTVLALSSRKMDDSVHSSHIAYCPTSLARPRSTWSPPQRKPNCPTTMGSLLQACNFYPCEKIACSTTGGSSGVIDPQSLRKYVWPIIKGTFIFLVHFLNLHF